MKDLICNDEIASINKNTAGIKRFYNTNNNVLVNQDAAKLRRNLLRGSIRDDYSYRQGFAAGIEYMISRIMFDGKDEE